MYQAAIPRIATRRNRRLRRLVRGITRGVDAVIDTKAVDRGWAVGRTERMNAMVMLTSSAEHLARPQERLRGGFNDWAIAGRGLQVKAPRLAKVIDLIAPPKITEALHWSRVAASVTLLAPTGPRARTAADLTLLGTTALLHPRSLYGTDGTDQVGWLVTANTSLARVGRHPAIVDTALWAIALQACISYGASGWVKVTSETWRSGKALTGVTRTQTYGDARAFKLLSVSPRATQVVSASVMAMECLFPFLYLKGGRIAPHWLFATLVFHLGNARIMGLGRFVWAFGSMHPAVRYTADARNKAERDDTLPRLTGAMGVAALVAGYVGQRRRRRRVSTALPGDKRLRTTRGNDLVYRVREGTDPDAPVIVLEAGLLASPRLWAPTVAALPRDATVVTYWRTGYGPSVRNADTESPYTLAESAHDLADLVREVSGDGRRRVVLAGHSLGGWIAFKAVVRAPELIDALVLIDSSHPAELQRSSRQAAGEKAVTLNLKMVYPSLAAGLGWLMEPLDYELPGDEHGHFEDEYRDVELWKAGLREWRATQQEFWTFDDGQLPAVACSVTALTAEQTQKLDEVQTDLHEELVAAGTSGERVVVGGTDHMGVITDPVAAAKVAGKIADVAAGLAAASHATAAEEAEHAG